MDPRSSTETFMTTQTKPKRRNHVMNLSPTPLVRNGFAEDCKNDREGPISRIYPNGPRSAYLVNAAKLRQTWNMSTWLKHSVGVEKWRPLISAGVVKHMNCQSSPDWRCSRRDSMRWLKVNKSDRCQTFWMTWSRTLAGAIPFKHP
jgi:hypothetical protein